MEVGLTEWSGVARAIIRSQEGMFAAIVPQRALGDPIEVSTAADPLFWPKVNAIRSVGSGASERLLVDELHHVTLSDIGNLPAQLVVAQPTRFVFDAPRRVAIGFVGGVTLLVVSLGVLVLLLARRLIEPVLEVSGVARAFSEGRLDARVGVRGRDEMALLGTAFNEMADTLQLTQHRMRVLNKSIMELFACVDADNILRKTVELACTQCLGEVAWFLPNQVGRSVLYAADSVFVGLHGWVWKSHRSYEITPKEAEAVWRPLDGDRVFSFTMKNQARELGVIKVAYKSAPDEATVSLLHSLISLVEMALTKQELIRREAMVATELDLAEAVQGNVMVGSLGAKSSKRVAYHYQPASRLGGDWFFMIEDTVRDKLYVVMGDVTGHGLAQGLVTTAVKGALDVLEMLIRSPAGSIVDGPAEIISFLERVVERVAGRSRLTMTCLAAEIDFGRQLLKICNAGHTFPILVRDVGGVNKADHLHKNQQPMLGQLADTAVSHAYVDVDYELQPGDLIVVYTDGLSEAKNLKSRIFGRFLMRALRKAHEYDSAADLRDEILQMFSYYTQGSHVEDDVCFLVVQVRGHDLGQVSA
jgi:serine phosphatase RsbU (regulator of sigma subunit)/HAMP domain-containing protein